MEPWTKCEIAELWVNFETSSKLGTRYSFEGGFLDENDVREKYGTAQVGIEGELSLFHNKRLIIKKEIGLESFEGN